MYVKEIIIDGFKTYAQRVTLHNFDPAFNAITGLNGSGKSNILDSICFLLGNKNLSQLRVSSLQELVYKQGSAGITKATVSIVFDNHDKANSPSGYEDKDYLTITRQIVIGGRDKYLINGHQAQASRVADLFQSVQLNVNNPHFLIMQGRVTKIMNMKPPEILSLLEEASGTKLFERKKDSALKTLEKKQKKLDEIDQLMEQELVPSLRKLEAQCAEYHEYAVTSQTHERLKRFCIAYEYSECLRQIEQGEQDAAGLQTEAAAVEAARAALQQEVADAESEVAALQAEKEIQAGGEVKELQKEVDELSMKLTKDSAACDNKVDTLKAEQSALKQLAAALADLDQQGLAAKVEAAEAAREAAAAALEAAEHGVEAANRELAGAIAGDGRDESNKSLQERLADAQNAQTAADADAQAAAIKVKMLTKQAAEQKKALGSKNKEAVQLQGELAAAQAALQKATTRLQAMGYDPAAVEGLEAARQQHLVALRSSKEALEQLEAQLGGLDFNYNAPEKGWNRNRVKGVVAKLVHLKDPGTALALEVTAGGRLYQVVVDSDATAKALLQKGGLQKRVTIIPLNQIRYSDLPQGVLGAARQLGGGKAQPALELVGYEGEVEAAVKYVFGSTFVCKDSGTAKKLAFSKDVARRCVTLEGDDFSPGGLLTGGSRPSGASVLTKLSQLAEAERELQQRQQSLSEVEGQLRKLAAGAKEYKKLHQEQEMQQTALSLLQERVAGSESHQLAEGLAATEASLAEAQEAAQAAQAKKKELVALAKQLEREIADFSKDHDKRVKAAQAKVKAAKQALEAAKKDLRAKEAAAAAAAAEAEAAAGQREKLEQQQTQAQATVAALEAEVAQLQQALADTKGAHGAAKGRLDAKRARLKECDAEIKALEKAKAGLVKEAAAKEAEKRRLDNKIHALRGDQGKASDRVAALDADYDWIAKEKHLFGASEYDFSALDPRKAYEEYKAAGERLQQLREKGIQRQADAMYLRNKEELESLQAKRTQVENDRRQISAVINELDVQKKAALEDTWRKVDSYFGSIFSTLLPGTQARLVPPEDKTFEDGLEVSVAFGGVWKESLTELSGGQRSLLALSLVLALCRFKPAPIYILDEVDAALDLNHTQNIGAMIKAHFPQSQFIVVSLKEGMFNNANVIFRTKFVDGVSNVTRTVNSTGHRENVAPAAGKAAQRGGAAAAAAGRGALRESNRG